VSNNAFEIIETGTTGTGYAFVVGTSGAGTVKPFKVIAQNTAFFDTSYTSGSLNVALSAINAGQLNLGALITTGTITIGGALTSAATGITIGGASQTGAILIGQSSGTQTVNISTTSGIKTVNIANGAGSSSVTTVNIANNSSAIRVVNMLPATGKFGIFNATAVVQQSVNTILVNNVTSGGTLSTIANYTDLNVYANDAAAIRNNFFRLTEKVLKLETALRNYGFAIN
jgi:hypothetical protein